MRYLIIAALIAIAGVAGYKAGQYSILNRIKRASSSLADELGKLADKFKAIQTPAPQPPAHKPTTDILAKGPLPVKPSDISAALGRGDIALFYGKGGNC